MIRVDSIWLATEPMDMRDGTETALARIVSVFGAAVRTVRWRRIDPAAEISLTQSVHLEPLPMHEMCRYMGGSVIHLEGQLGTGVNTSGQAERMPSAECCSHGGHGDQASTSLSMKSRIFGDRCRLLG